MKRFWTAGCVLGLASVAVAQEASTRAPAPENYNAAQLMQRNGGSLLRASLTAAPDPDKAALSSVSYFVVPKPEPKTIKKHDLLTIIIREESEMNSEASTDLRKSTSLDAQLDEWIRLRPENFAIEGGGEGDNPPSARFGGTRDFAGEGTVDRSDSFIARIQAEVIDVKPNGTFAIQARKRIKHDDEEQEYVMTGLCQASDLTVDNSIMSWQIHDMQIETRHKGAVRDSTKRGFVPRLLDFVNPF